MSGLEIWALVLQSSSSFNLNVFFNSYPVYFFLVKRAIFNYCIYGPFVPLGFFERSRIMFLLLFFVWNLQIVFPLKPMFSKGPSFFVLLFVIMGLYFVPARGRPASVSDHVMTSQEYLKVEHVRTWLLSSTFAKFQQFWSECFFSSFV